MIRRAFLSFFSLLMVTACGGATGDAIDGPATAPSGTCRFTIDGPSGTRTIVLDGIAAMRHDALRAECGVPELSFLNAPLTITFGDRRYRGPGEYLIDASHNDGSFEFASAGDRYTARSGRYATTACRLQVVSGPPGAALPGDRLHATFTCHDIPEERGGVLSGRAEIRDGEIDVVVP